MKHLLIYLIGIIALSSCAKAPDEAAELGSFSHEVRLAPSAPKGRFYFIHGMGQHLSDLKAGQWARMGDHMSAAGFEVVYIEWAFIKGPAMSNQGQDYVNRWQAYIKTLDDKLQAERPVALTYFGGSSMGAWHSIVASEVVPAAAVYAIEPVVYLPILWPFADSDTTHANLNGGFRTLPSNLFVTVGLADTSVGYWFSQRLFSQSAQGYEEFPGEIHAPYADQFDAAMAWLDQQTLKLSQNDGVRCAPYGTTRDEMNCHYRRNTIWA